MYNFKGIVCRYNYDILPVILFRQKTVKESCSMVYILLYGLYFIPQLYIYNSGGNYVYITATYSIKTESSNRVLLLVNDADGAVQVVVGPARRARPLRALRHRLRAAPGEHRSDEHFLTIEKTYHV